MRKFFQNKKRFQLVRRFFVQAQKITKNHILPGNSRNQFLVRKTRILHQRIQKLPHKIFVDRKKTGREQNTDKIAIGIAIRIAIMKTLTVYKNTFPGPKRNMLPVDIIGQLAVQQKNKFKIIMPVAGSTKIRIGRQLPQLDIGWKIRNIIDHIFGKIRI